MADDIDQPEDNEAIRAAKRAKRAKASADENESKTMGWKTAAGIGIGSAAVVAALIYANKARKKDDD